MINCSCLVRSTENLLNVVESLFIRCYNNFYLKVLANCIKKIYSNLSGSLFELGLPKRVQHFHILPQRNARDVEWYYGKNCGFRTENLRDGQTIEYPLANSANSIEIKQRLRLIGLIFNFCSKNNGISTQGLYFVRYENLSFQIVISFLGFRMLTLKSGSY